MTSSSCCQSAKGFLCAKARKGVAARSSVRTDASAPPYRPMGVRMASQMNTYFMVFLGVLHELAAAFEVAESIELDRARESGFSQRFGEANFPASRFADLFASHAGVKLYDGEFFGDFVRF